MDKTFLTVIQNRLNKQESRWLRQSLRLFLFFTLLMSSSINLLAQNKIVVSVKDTEMKEVLRLIEKQSDFTFRYNTQDLKSAGSVTVDVNANNVEEALDKCLAGTGLTYEIQANTVVIKPQVTSASEIAQQPEQVDIKGKVTDVSGFPLPGVTVIIKGTNIVTSGDASGMFGF